MCQNPHTFSRNLARPTERARTSGSVRYQPNDSCDERAAVANYVSLGDICLQLRDENFGDGLQPNVAEAKIIAEKVYGVLETVRNQGGEG